MDLNTPTPHTTASSTAVPTRDNVYCLELAKRSVARAALHLGISSMTDDVLNVLGDVLCEYLQRLGAVLAHNVESSGRSTQHVNSLDALRAVELCTSPAVSRVHFTSSGASSNSNTAGSTVDGTRNSNSNTANGNNNSETPQANATTSTSNNNNSGNPRNDMDSNTPSHPPGSWQGLAAFCFGPKWHEDSPPEDEESEELQGAGGKVGPKAADGSQQEEAAKDCQEGWRAPFPDEVPLFPQCSTTRVSNPHAMTQTDVLKALYGSSLASPGTTSSNPTDLVRGPNLISSEEAEQERQGMEKVLSDMPESAWGGMDSKKNTDPNNAAATDAAGNTNKTTEPVKSDDAAKPTEDAAAGGKRKLDEKDEEEATKKEDANNNDKDKMDTTGDDKKDNDEAAAQPPKKKVKLDDGSSKAKTPTSTPKKKKKDDKEDAADKDTKADEAKSDAEEDTEDANKANQTKAAGPTYNYVPTFMPPIPTMAVGDNAAKMRKTTVVDLLEQQASSTEPAQEDTTAGATTAASAHTSFQLRSALVQLGTSYWGSQADAEPKEEPSMVPVGRSGAPSAAQPPIVPLGRASGSRVSRILEGSMDAAAMQQ